MALLMSSEGGSRPVVLWTKTFFVRSEKEPSRVLDCLTDLSAVLQASFLGSGKGNPRHFSTPLTSPRTSAASSSRLQAREGAFVRTVRLDGGIDRGGSVPLSGAFV